MPRTDNDTWNLATSVGATATMVAAARAIATKADNPVIEDRFAEPLVRAVGVDFFTRWASGEVDAADLDDHESTWKLGHMPDAMAARTRFFDAFFRDAAQAGIRQAVILAGLGAAPKADLRTVAIDLRQDWPEALLEAGLDKSRPTAWIAEGLFGYLPPEAQDALLENITALSAPGSRFACEAVPARPEIDKEQARETMRKASAKWREHGLELDFTELGFQGERNDAAAHLQDLGWRTVGTPMRQLLADHQLLTIPQNSAGVSVADTVYYSSVLDK